VREACATCEMGYVRAIYVFVMRLFLVHIDRHTHLSSTDVFVLVYSLSVVLPVSFNPQSISCSS